MNTSSIAVIAAVISACAAIASAIISALISLSIAKRSHSQKIAEFRKEWIENLRSHFAEFHSTYFVLRVLEQLHEKTDKPEERARILDQRTIKFERLRFLNSYILLMLNPTEELHQQMEARINKMVQDLVSKKENQAAQPEGQPKIPTFSDLARKILKTEWDRLKSTT